MLERYERLAYWMLSRPGLSAAAMLGATVLVVTHDKAVAESCPRTIHIRDGKIHEDIRR